MDRPRILIADDDPTMHSILGELLGQEGYRLESAMDGVQALDKARSFGPDLLLLDLMMPEMDGFEVLHRLRADPSLAGLPVVVVTAMGDKEACLRGIDAGADDVVAKPFDPTVLLARVRTITRLNRYRRFMAERARFEWVVESAEAGYLLLDGQGRVEYANPSAMRLLGLPGQGWQGAVFMDLAARENRLVPEEGWTPWPPESEEDLRAKRYLLRRETATAQASWLEVGLLRHRDASGAAFLVRLRDVSECMANRREMWTFHSMVSHKLRTPLNMVVGGLDMLRDLAGEPGCEEASALAAPIFEEVQRLEHEIDDILDFVEAPTLARTGEEFALGELSAMVEGICSRLGIVDASIVIEPSVAGRVLGISARAMETALWEVLENAHKFHPEKRPRVEVAVERAGDGRVRLAVSDDGIHLPPRLTSRVFAPYFQGEKYHTGQMQGMGLGLAMVAAMVWEAGGDCALSNRDPGPGVAVEFVLRSRPGEG